MSTFFANNWVRQSLVVLGIIILWQIGAIAFRAMAKSDGEKILAPLSKNSSIQVDGMINLSTLEQQDLKRLLNLYSRIDNKKEQHKQAFLTFYPYHFASSALLLILSSVSVIIIFLTAQVGLKNTSPYLQTIFFTLAALTTFYALTPLVFKQEANITVNLNKYILYDNLEGEIYNYAVTKPNTNTFSDTAISFTRFHSWVTKSMADINSINVEFDYKVIPRPDFGMTKK